MSTRGERVVEHRLAVVHGLLELFFKHGIVHPAAAGLHAVPRLRERERVAEGRVKVVGGKTQRRSDGDAGVRIAVEAEVAHATAIRPARRAFEIGDELHGANLRRAAHRARRKCRAYQTLMNCPALDLLRAMKPSFHLLDSADKSPWKDSLSSTDRLPIRDSGAWIDTKHKLLTYYAHLFATGMKNAWKSRVYLELFSGPGRCLIRKTGKEDLGSPLKVIEHGFTKFIFTEKNVAAANALAQRLESFENAANTEIWCGDCADAIKQIQIPASSLTLAFIDPTGIGHAPFSLIETLHRKTRCDLLINIQHGMGIKMNIHQYTPDAGEQSALTKFLGNDSWKQLPRHNPREFFRGVLELYKEQLHGLGFKRDCIGREVLITNDSNTPLYLLLFASKHPKGKEFWDKAMKGVLPMELDFGS